MAATREGNTSRLGNHEPAPHAGIRPLVVDLDGTLVRTDLLVETALALLRRNVLYLLMFPIWLLRGKARLKSEIASRVSLDASLLPYNDELVQYLREQRKDRHSLVLATASNELIANEVARHLELFDTVLASSATSNLSAETKRDTLVATYGSKGFDYVGNSQDDLPVWAAANAAILVDAPVAVHEATGTLTEVGRVFRSDSGAPPAYVESLRPHQWLKNILIFAPFFAAQQLDDPRLWLACSLGFGSFCLCASGAYVLNDLLDVHTDRSHPGKRDRPFAAGRVPVAHGLILAPVLLLLAVGTALLVSKAFLAVLGLYLALTVAYSLRLKQMLMLDTVVLAGLYTLRLLAGSAAIAVPPSPWFLAFSMFLFLSLALVKRYSELLGAHRQGRARSYGRSYAVEDLGTLRSIGTSSGYLAVLVLALYINSSKVQEMYSHPELIWLLCPLLIYWVGRLWLLTARGRVQEDPVLFAIEDRASHWVAVSGVVVLLLAN